MEKIVLQLEKKKTFACYDVDGTSLDGERCYKTFEALITRRNGIVDVVR